MEKIEFEDILDFAEGADFEDAANVKKLRLMWTEFCNDDRNGIGDVDTYEYDSKLMQIWETMCDNLTCPYSSMEFSRFDDMMAKFLV